MKDLFPDSMISESLGKRIEFVWRKTVTFLRRSKTRIASFNATEPIPFSTPFSELVRLRLAFDLRNNSQIFGRRKTIFILYFKILVLLYFLYVCVWVLLSFLLFFFLFCFVLFCFLFFFVFCFFNFFFFLFLFLFFTCTKCSASTIDYFEEI